MLTILLQLIDRLKAIQSRAPDWQILADRVKKFVISTSSIAGGIIFIGFLNNSIFTSSVEIEPIKIPDSFVQKGYSPEIATVRVLDEVAKIREVSTVNLRSKSIKTKLPGEELSKLQSQPLVGGIDINLIKSLVQTSLGIRQERISSEITISEANGKVSYSVRMRSNFDHKLLVDFSSDKDIPGLLREIAIKLVERVDPVAASSYYRWNKDYRNSLRLIDEALRDDRTDDDLYALNNRASMYIQLKKYDLAQGDLDRVFAADQNFAWSINVQSYLLNETGKHQEALIWAKRAQKLLSDRWQPYANAGDAYKGLKNFELAKAEYLDALDRNPNWFLQYLEMVDFFTLIKDEKNLDRTFLQALRRFPRNTELLLKYTNYLVERGRPEQAAHYLTLAYQESPDSPEVWSAYLTFSGPKDKILESEIKKKMH